MGNLGTLASSMLVLAPVMRGAVAEAFLSTLAACGKYQASNKDIMTAYSKFYGLLLQAGYESWPDYLLDQALLGRDSSLARAVAQGGLGEGAPILDALAHDLEVLQALAVGMPELAEYVGDMAPLVGPEWVQAASSASLRRPAKRLGGGDTPRVSGISLGAPPRFIARPPTSDELGQWKSSIASKESWSEAVPLVVQYWATHGFGITSRNSALRWVKGALEEGPDPAPPGQAGAPTSSPLVSAAAPLTNLSVLEPQRAALAANTARHCEGLPASHALVAGPSGSGKSWLLWDSTLAAGRERGLRVVDVGADAGAILEAARGCGRYPRLRFVVVADHVDMPLRGSTAADIMAGLSSTGASGWPSNTLLYLGASASSSVSLDPVVARFGLKLFMPKALDHAQFAQALKELAGVMVPKGEPVPDVPEEQLAKAIAWAEANDGGLSVRAAAAWLSRYFNA